MALPPDYPDGKLYEILYLRYLKRPPRQLLELAGLRPGERVLDLCGGTGRLSRAALEMGASQVVLVDRSEKMTRLVPRGITVHHTSVEEALKTYIKEGILFDVVACQQGVNYWLNEQTARQVASVLDPGGRFVFNTFWRKPGHEPRIREYRLDGRHYVEISYLAGEQVYHVQVCEGLPPHVTHFRWIPREQFEQWLRCDFNILRHTDGTTDIYVAIKK